MRVKAVWEFAKKRHLIYLRREAGDAPETWTDDPILQRFRFCNVYRELDTVTAWLHKHWLYPNSEHPDLWHAFVVARHMNNIPMLEALGPTLPWDPEWFCIITENRRLQGEKVFGAAYMIGTRHKGSKAVYLANEVFTPLWRAREQVRPRPGDTLTSWHMQLGLWYGLASFMSAQVVADIKHVGALALAPDRHTFCASGPGSRRGLNRVMNRALKSSWKEDEFRLRVTELRIKLAPLFFEQGWAPPDAQNVQNILCEFDKYERARLGQGRPKQLFKGGLYAQDAKRLPSPARESSLLGGPTDSVGGSGGDEGDGEGLRRLLERGQER
jgi:5-hmdU DNA kinase, helical domain